jgi:ABC-type sugar transport system ATPase subunit
LIKILAGAYQPDEGEIRLDGKTMLFRTPRDAMEGGIRTVFQELSLCDNLDVAANLFLGSELEKRVFNLVLGLTIFGCARKPLRSCMILRSISRESIGG